MGIFSFGHSSTTQALVMPFRFWRTGGVKTLPPLTMKILSPEPSAMFPRVSKMTASSPPFSLASILARMLFR
jgi:hypothetical protein